MSFLLVSVNARLLFIALGALGVCGANRPSKSPSTVMSSASGAFFDGVFDEFEGGFGPLKCSDDISGYNDH